MWLAADYSSGLIREWFNDRGWPELSRNTFKYYRRHYEIDIKSIREERQLRALTTGLAIKAERIERLKHHADSLEAIKWEPDKNGRLWNEKAWRETLEDIAAELGDRKQPVEHSGTISIVKSYITINPDDWDQADSDVQPAAVADQAVARQVASPATDG